MNKDDFFLNNKFRVQFGSDIMIMMIPLIICFLSLGIFNNQNSENRFYHHPVINKSIQNWQGITSVKDIWKKYPNRLRTLFNELDLNRPGLDHVKNDLQKEDTIAAAKALLAYYRNSKSGYWLRSGALSNVDNDVLKTANSILNDTMDVHNETVHIPRNKDGGLDWNYLGPKKLEEFGYDLNRQFYLLTLLKAWQETHKSKYAHGFDRLIRDWTIHNPLPAKGDSIYIVINTPTSVLDWRNIGEVRWRLLEAGLRMGRVWPQTFYGFQQSKAFTPAARLLMLYSIYNHAKYIYQYHENHHNHALMELNGLALVATAFPEFKDAKKWFKRARIQMLAELHYLIYPDGVSKELTTTYDIVALNAFERFHRIASHAHIKLGSAYTKILGKMYNYLAYSMRPDGDTPLNNDSDLKNIRKMILDAAHKYNRPDWEWIATNGAIGKKPTGEPSKMFPWAGIQIMRSGWRKNAQWSFFDVGPWGTSHEHNDKLHISISAYGKDLLVDSGRYTYNNYFSFNPVTWRGYFRSSFSHNVILVDGKGQNVDTSHTAARSPLKKGVNYITKPSFDYVRGTFDGSYNNIKGKANQTRAIFYRRGEYWVVVDHIQTDRPRKIQALWHYAPDCNLKIEGKETESTNPGEANLGIIPIGNMHWNVKIVKGQIKPIKQGWYSPKSGIKYPSPVAIYSAVIKKSTTFAWLLVPDKGMIPQIKISSVKLNGQKAEMCIKEADEETTKITVPLNNRIIPSITKNCKND